MNSKSNIRTMNNTSNENMCYVYNYADKEQHILRSNDKLIKQNINIQIQFSSTRSHNSTLQCRAKVLPCAAR